MICNFIFTSCSDHNIAGQLVDRMSWSPEREITVTDAQRNPDLIQTIRRRYDSLSEAHKKVAEFVIDNLEKATFASLSDMAAQIGVSDATLIRFAQEFGFHGFKEFREHLADYIRKIIYTKLPAGDGGGRESGSVVDRVAGADTRYIQRTMAGVDRDRFDRLVTSVVKAGRVFCMGWRISSFLAEFMAFQLRRLSYDTRAIIRERRTLLEQVLDLDKGDLLIVFDMMLYSTEVYEAVEYVGINRPGVQIVTVTNDPLAQIVQFADLSFFIDMAGHGEFSIISLTAPMSFINATVEGVVQAEPKRAASSLTRYEREVLSRRRHAMIIKPQ